jgi:hypothetical protein
MFIKLLLWILITKKLKLQEIHTFMDQTKIWGRSCFVDLSMFTCETRQGSMASFGSSMSITGEGTTIAGACHLGVLSAVEEGASASPVPTAGIDGERPTL